jgi:hypothetical protein
VRDENHTHLGILNKLKSKAEAERYINDREREAAAAEAALGGAVPPQVSNGQYGEEPNYTEEEVAAMFAQGGE